MLFKLKSTQTAFEKEVVAPVLVLAAVRRNRHQFLAAKTRTAKICFGSVTNFS